MTRETVAVETTSRRRRLLAAAAAAVVVASGTGLVLASEAQAGGSSGARGVRQDGNNAPGHDCPEESGEVETSV